MKNQLLCSNSIRVLPQAPGFVYVEGEGEVPMGDLLDEEMWVVGVRHEESAPAINRTRRSPPAKYRLCGLLLVSSMIRTVIWTQFRGESNREESVGVMRQS